MSEYNISPDYLNILNSKVNTLYDHVKQSKSSHASSNSSNNTISTLKMWFVILILIGLGIIIYNYLDKTLFDNADNNNNDDDNNDDDNNDDDNEDDDNNNEDDDNNDNDNNDDKKKKKKDTNHTIPNLKYTVKELNKHTNTYEPDNTNNNMQNNKKHKSGKFCYLGSDRGFRSCIKLSKHQECESGKLFPTMEMCINPQLRYT